MAYSANLKLSTWLEHETQEAVKSQRKAGKESRSKLAGADFHPNGDLKEKKKKKKHSGLTRESL